MTTTQEYIAEAMQAMMTGEEDRAIGLLFKASLAYDDEIVVNAPKVYDKPCTHVCEQHPRPVNLPKGTELPPLKPISDKRVTARSVACPTCKAKPGKPCHRMTIRGRHGKPTDETLLDGKGKPMFHKTRFDRAKKAKGTV